MVGMSWQARNQIWVPMCYGSRTFRNLLLWIQDRPQQKWQVLWSSWECGSIGLSCLQDILSSQALTLLKTKQLKGMRPFPKAWASNILHHCRWLRWKWRLQFSDPVVPGDRSCTFPLERLIVCSQPLEWMDKGPEERSRVHLPEADSYFSESLGLVLKLSLVAVVVPHCFF